MAGYSKLFSEIVTSSIWSEDDKTRIVWITMLALKDSRGFVPAALPGLANAARVSLDECAAAIAKLEAPDPYSRTKDHDGRRIMPSDGGWMVLNHEKYREKRSDDDRREYQRRWQAEHRRRQNVDHVDTNVDSVDTMLTHTDTDTDTDKKEEEKSAQPAKAPAAPRPRFSKPTPAEVAEYAKTIGYTLDGQSFVDSYEAKGWLIGKTPMKNWKAAVRTWKIRDYPNGVSTSRKPMGPTANDRVVAHNRAVKEIVLAIRAARDMNKITPGALGDCLAKMRDAYRDMPNALREAFGIEDIR